MKPPPEDQALKEVARRLAELLESPAKASQPAGSAAGSQPDAVVRAGGHVYLIEWKASGDVAGVSAGIRQLASIRNGSRASQVALLAVPFMGEAGRRICSESDVSWLDLSGNARIDAPGVHVRVEGKENRFKRRGRPSNPFAPKSSRVARWLLLHPDEYHVQQELAAAIDLGAGFVSRVVRRLEELELIERNEQGAVRASDPKLLLEAWGEHYEFERHHLLRGHVTARSGDELLARVSSALTSAGIEARRHGAGRCVAAHALCSLPHRHVLCRRTSYERCAGQPRIPRGRARRQPLAGLSQGTRGSFWEPKSRMGLPVRIPFRSGST